MEKDTMTRKWWRYPSTRQQGILSQMVQSNFVGQESAGKFKIII
jgi:hypothetical protein